MKRRNGAQLSKVTSLMPWLLVAAISWGCGEGVEVAPEPDEDAADEIEAVESELRSLCGPDYRLVKSVRLDSDATAVVGTLGPARLQVFSNPQRRICAIARELAPAAGGRMEWMHVSLTRSENGVQVEEVKLSGYYPDVIGPIYMDRSAKGCIRPRAILNWQNTQYSAFVSAASGDSAGSEEWRTRGLFEMTGTRGLS